MVTRNKTIGQPAVIIFFICMLYIVIITYHYLFAPIKGSVQEPKSKDDGVKQDKIADPINIKRLNRSKAERGINEIIWLNIIPDFDGWSKKQIAEYRISKVKEYAHLNIFPSDYHPLKRPHS